MEKIVAAPYELLRKHNPSTFSVLRSMINYLFIIDFSGKTILTSQSVLEDTQRDQNFFDRNHYSDYITDPNNQHNILSSLLLMMPNQEKELELVCSDGNKIPVLLLSTSILKEFYEDEDLIMLLCADMRLQKKAQASMIQSNKMASLGEMSSSLAHELNNPITIMEGQLRRLEDYITDEDIDEAETLNLISKVQKNLMRVTKIVKSFRAISRKGDNDPFAFVSIKSLLDEVEELTGQRMKNYGVEFQSFCKDTSVELQCRESSLLQVFINLINNAVDAIKNKEEKWIKLHCGVRKNKVFFSVMDSGEGISIENQIRLFEPFFTTKDIGEGTGLGLSISKGIIEEHSGTLTYEQKAKNSCFVIVIPLTQEIV